ncbi:MAG: hypothetical protein U0X58_04010 [Flavobacteriaceae bacterium]
MLRVVSVTGLPPGVSGVLTGNTYTISGTPTSDGSYPFTVNTTGGCWRTTHRDYYGKPNRYDGLEFSGQYKQSEFNV